MITEQVTIDLPVSTFCVNQGTCRVTTMEDVWLYEGTQFIYLLTYTMSVRTNIYTMVEGYTHDFLFEILVFCVYVMVKHCRTKLFWVTLWH